LQVQFFKVALPAGELEFDGQAMQSADPFDAWYFPATHAVHMPGLGMLQEASKPG
jgi:hypothetical protein